MADKLGEKKKKTGNKSEKNGDISQEAKKPENDTVRKEVVVLVVGRKREERLSAVMTDSRCGSPTFFPVGRPSSQTSHLHLSRRGILFHTTFSYFIPVLFSVVWTCSIHI